MGAFVFDKCCCCIELKTGCFIIGYLSLVCYVILAIVGVVGVAAGGVIAADHSDADNQEAGTVVMAISIFLILITVVLLTFIIVLLVGLHQNKPGHVKAYLIYACIFLVISVVMYITNIISRGPDVKYIVESLINTVWSIYIILVIRSQYFAMKNPERGPAIYSSA